MRKVQPTISVVMPCRNEKVHIEACLRSVLAQEPLQGGMEIIVFDGMSDDGTRDILTRLKEEDSRFKVVDNIKQITPCARNLGIRAARGKYIAILDAHAVYAPTYIHTCVDFLEEHPEVCCVGGPITAVGKGIFGCATALAMSSIWGVGNAKHRFPNYEGYAEGACFPVFRREIFDEVGLFDEELIKNQDDEFNFRIARSGGKFYLLPRAQCTYYVRESPRQLFWQYFQYGFYRVRVLKKHRLPIAFRHFIPVLFFSAMGTLFLLSFMFNGWLKLAGLVLPTVYGSILGLGAVSVAIKKGIGVGLWFPVAAFILHFAYALGFVWECLGARKVDIAKITRE